MCNHFGQTETIIDEIIQKDYPLLDKAFESVVHHLTHHNVCSQASDLYELFFKLKYEFDSLKNYEIKLVFPAVLQAFGTANEAKRPAVNFPELRDLVLKKEQGILARLADLEQECELLSLPEDHALFAFAEVFRKTFSESKQRWHNMLNARIQTCACFRANTGFEHNAETPNKIEQ